MTEEKLKACPNWPALMEEDVAISYLGGKGTILKALVENGYLERFTDRHRCVTYRRSEIDDAIAAARANGDALELKKVS